MLAKRFQEINTNCWNIEWKYPFKSFNFNDHTVTNQFVDNTHSSFFVCKSKESPLPALSFFVVFLFDFVIFEEILIIINMHKYTLFKLKTTFVTEQLCHDLIKWKKLLTKLKEQYKYKQNHKKTKEFPLF